MFSVLLIHYIIYTQYILKYYINISKCNGCLHYILKYHEVTDAYNCLVPGTNIVSHTNILTNTKKSSCVPVVWNKHADIMRHILI